MIVADYLRRIGFCSEPSATLSELPDEIAFVDALAAYFPSQ